MENVFYKDLKVAVNNIKNISKNEKNHFFNFFDSDFGGGA